MHRQEKAYIRDIPLIATSRKLVFVFEYSLFHSSRIILIGGKRSRGFFALGLGASSSSAASSALGGAASFLTSLGFAGSFGCEGFLLDWTGGIDSTCFTSPNIFWKFGWLTKVQKYLSTWGNSEVKLLVKIRSNQEYKLQVVMISDSVTECPTR